LGQDLDDVHFAAHFQTKMMKNRLVPLPAQGLPKIRRPNQTWLLERENFEF
jgi:hypothetical protein